MTIIQLATFLKIAETQNFTTAANQLGYAQSTVTTQIRQLEDELGCLLFERLGKTVVLTPEGEKLTVYAEKMMQIRREIMLEVPMVKEPAGVLRLGVSESLCYNRLPRLLLALELRVEIDSHDARRQKLHCPENPTQLFIPPFPAFIMPCRWKNHAGKVSGKPRRLRRMTVHNSGRFEAQ